MIAYGIDMNTLAQAAEETGVRLNETDTRGKGIKFTLRPEGDTFRKISPDNGRRINAVCWHGHKAFFDYLFTLAPNARIKSQCADYKGSDDYDAKYADTDTPLFGRLETFRQSDCCDCA